MKKKTRQAQGTVKPHQIPPPEDMPTPEQLAAFRKRSERNRRKFIQNLNRASREA